MSIYGVGVSGYSAAGYGYTNTKRTTTGTNSGGYTETVQKSEMAGGAFVLHYFDNEEGERAVGATCGTDYSVTAYIPKDFDPDNPVYKVKVWDKDGNVTERMVDLSQVDPNNSDFIDMYAYSCYLEKSGKCPGAESAFMGSNMTGAGAGGMSYDDLFEKTDWMDELKKMMQMQYHAGNRIGYLEYKKFWDYLNAGEVFEPANTAKPSQKAETETFPAEEVAKKANMTASYNGIPLEERTGMDKKYTDKETGISYYVADGKYPYITGEDAEKLKKLCDETGENYLKKMAEITGTIRYLNDNTTAYIGDNGTAIKSKDGKELWIDTSLLSYDVLSYMFGNPDRKGDYFSAKYWSDRMQNTIGDYLTMG